MKRALLIASAVVLFGQMPDAYAQQVTASGCAEAGVENGCVMLKDGNKLYNITHAVPKPVVGAYGTVTGTVSGDPDTCQQGDLLKAAEWKIDPEKSCANK
ncbi:hypothetical protein [Mesorhizobium sp. M00.F.Ca.ET.217.01.1.1]|uniref:hypothetical protein n=1 Tax=Mesorhizobium sp. M00.F.Ca.ET.217.01.1.1 TaxID=2500529 RepID=UPI000FDA6477|nr:hypothetical protein [Mesorhizobium sp. M00.F.Ca.ET.217.01.1.1]TGQ13570.1 hypothetical protein EN860_030520 [Mesorhizobium sp. M00.F.Ca.ET.217.01.1.1]TGV85435.1 hypothetical protein EN801_029230 [Mesorhizobium sp. M00.F.Ca.ET.158.01.1.1]